VRARLRCFDRHRPEFRKCWEEDTVVGVAAGRGYAVLGDDEDHRFVILNTTTAAVEYRDVWAARGVRFGRFVNPQLAAGAFVGVVRAPRMRLYFPDPLGGEPRHVVDLTAHDLASLQGGLGPVDDDARVYIEGSTVYVLRIPLQGRKHVSVSVFGIDYAGLSQHDPTDEGGNGSVFYMRNQKIWLSGSPTPARYVLSVRPGFEGVFVNAAVLTGEHRAEHWWVAASRELRPILLFEGETRDARRHPPVRIGDRLYIPADDGAVVYRVQRGG
jgi:hypothetical protein